MMFSSHIVDFNKMHFFHLIFNLNTPTRKKITECFHFYYDNFFTLFVFIHVLCNLRHFIEVQYMYEAQIHIWSLLNYVKLIHS